MKNISIFLGSSVQHFKEGYVIHGKVTLKTFPSGEKYCRFDDNIRDKDVFLVQSLSSPVNDNLMELLVMADAARRASAGRITFVMPYMGYQRQDRKTVPREPISAKLTIDLMENAGANRLMTIDAHNLCCQGFTNLPFDHLFSFPIIQDFLRDAKNKYRDKNLCFVAPDVGALKRTQAYADQFGVDLAIVNKKRLNASEVVARNIIGDVKGKDVIIVDDLTESCSTLISAARICKLAGSASQSVVVTHCCLSLDGRVNLENALNEGIITKFITTNTVPNIAINDWREEIHVIDAYPMIHDAIMRIHDGKSITDMFELKGF